MATGTEFPPLDGPRVRRRRSEPLTKGETITIGAPAEKITVSVSNGRALREIELWGLSMGDAYEVCERALRERLEQPFKRVR